MRPNIAVPCHEDWDKMKIGVLSRHCSVCEKSVMDFTQMSRVEMLQYLLENKNQNVCGRAYKHQFDITHEETLVVIKNLEQKHRNTNLSFYLLSMATLTLMSCEQHPSLSGIKKGIHKTEISTPKATKEKLPDLLPQVKFIPPEILEGDYTFVQEGIVSGGISVLPPKVIDEQPTLGEMVIEVIEPPMIAEIMPEFPGGTDSLMQFIKSHLSYPKWERKKGIQGTVYAQFTVDTTGKILHPTILKSVEGSRHFDKEVLSIIRKMPDWIPGSTNGKKTAIQFNLPFKFEL